MDLTGPEADDDADLTQTIEIHDSESERMETGSESEDSKLKLISLDDKAARAAARDAAAAFHEAAYAEAGRSA